MPQMHNEEANGICSLFSAFLKVKSKLSLVHLGKSEERLYSIDILHYQSIFNKFLAYVSSPLLLLRKPFLHQLTDVTHSFFTLSL